eukprot:scaffold179112_cov36-Tisochrysis_lutea.AAC.1
MTSISTSRAVLSDCGEAPSPALSHADAGITMLVMYTRIPVPRIQPPGAMRAWPLGDARASRFGTVERHMKGRGVSSAAPRCGKTTQQDNHPRSVHPATLRRLAPTL